MSLPNTLSSEAIRKFIEEDPTVTAFIAWHLWERDLLSIIADINASSLPDKHTRLSLVYRACSIVSGNILSVSKTDRHLELEPFRSLDLKAVGRFYIARLRLSDIDIDFTEVMDNFITIFIEVIRARSNPN